ncbi:MAG: hypothetical protein IPH44_33525 [Myxococcales bacterium]|nr:hypothetical protein [Myxococcales bacterium]
MIIERAIDDDLIAEVDPRLVGRVLGCLLDNAVRYTPRGGRIAIRATAAGAELELAVGNSGPALSAPERARVFERDFRRAEREDGARRGRGLGLHFCRLVAEAHGGSITAGSQPTLPVEFVLRLPAAELAAQRRRSAQAAAQERRRRRRPARPGRLQAGPQQRRRRARGQAGLVGGLGRRALTQRVEHRGLLEVQVLEQPGVAIAGQRERALDGGQPGPDVAEVTEQRPAPVVGLGRGRGLGQRRLGRGQDHREVRTARHASKVRQIVIRPHRAFQADSPRQGPRVASAPRHGPRPAAGPAWSPGASAVTRAAAEDSGLHLPAIAARRGSWAVGAPSVR